MDNHARPIVVASACLEFDACRYNGERIPFDFLAELLEHVDVVRTCPEVEIGLGTPRDPIRLVRASRGPRLVQPSTGTDVTVKMKKFSKAFLADRSIDGFILKSRSPSCGTGGVKIYDEADRPSVMTHGPGLFADAVLQSFPDAAIEDEGRLRNYRIREHFLTKLFALSELRRVAAAGRIAGLVDFHSRYKLILMAYNQTAMRELGRVVANPSRRPFPELISDYRAGLTRAFQRVPGTGAVVNALEHAWGYVSDRLAASERAYYRRQVERYRTGRMPVSAPLAVIETSLHRFDVEYLLGQALFHPYPDALRSVADSGKGRSRKRR
ncbi:MAG: DUF523 and DUF1722 domain-containing protein [Gemmatimonadota bacterium]|nr:DUF523 and DUF1722 domain-containing protein [Gemmatimonadota bacterium]